MNNENLRDVALEDMDSDPERAKTWVLEQLEKNRDSFLKNVADMIVGWYSDGGALDLAQQQFSNWNKLDLREVERRMEDLRPEWEESGE